MNFWDLHKKFEQWANPQYAENYDNVGLIVGEYQTEIRGILINLDVTEEVLEEAEQLGCNLIITHHPIWFQTRKRLNGEDYVSRIIMKAIRKNIGLYAIHTNLDNVQHGVNQKIAKILDLEKLEFIRKHPQLEIGSGLMGTLKKPIHIFNLMDIIKEKFKIPTIKYSKAFNKDEVQKIGVCGGSGSFLIPDVLKNQLDVFITSDVTYHKFFDNENQFYLLDIGHHESEQFTTEIIFDFIKKIHNFVVYLSKVNTNPVHYY